MELNFKSWMETWDIQGQRLLGDFNKYKNSVKDPKVIFGTEGAVGDAISDYLKSVMPKASYEEKLNFMLKHQNICLVELDPCKTMKQFKGAWEPWGNLGHYTNMMQNPESQDVGLPLIRIGNDKLEIFDGNHRFTAACQTKTPAYAAVLFLPNMKILEKFITKVIVPPLQKEQAPEAPQKSFWSRLFS